MISLRTPIFFCIYYLCSDNDLETNQEQFTEMFGNKYSKKDMCFPGSTPDCDLSYLVYTCTNVPEPPIAVLNFKDNKSLAAIIPLLTGYTRLIITACHCTTLPKSLGQLTQLTELHITFNRCLRTIPDIFGSLENLEKLSFKAAHIQTLPASVGQLKKLKELYLYECKYLRTVPVAVTNMQLSQQLQIYR